MTEHATQTSRQRSSWRTMLVLQGLDTPFIPVVIFGWAALLSVQVQTVFAVGLIMHVIRASLTLLYTYWKLQPVDDWQAAPERASEAQVHAVNDLLQRAPTQIALFYGFGWLLACALATAWVRFAMSDLALIGPGEALAGYMMAGASLFGCVSMMVPVVSMLLSRERAAMSRQFAASEFAVHTRGTSLSRQLTFFLLCLVITSASLVLATGWSNNVAFDRFQSVSDLGSELARDIDRVELGLEPQHASVVDSDALPAQAKHGAIDVLPKDDFRITVDRRSRRASVAQPLDDGSWLLLEGPIRSNDVGFGTKLLLFFVVILLWAPLTIVLLVRSLISPLRELELRMSRLVEVGDIREIEPLPIGQHDEVGKLTRSFNHLLDTLRELAEAVREVSQGELTIELDGHGDLHDAFRTMLGQLHEMVVNIRETAVEVAAVSAEIYAASQQQEAAAAISSQSVRDASVTVGSLASAAERITTTADGVLDNAGRTLTTSDAMVERINELNTQAASIGDLLDLIREIADRSDLLALNGSLEATRAGEAGRGFALVATEMRRLAERVTKAVTEMRERVAGISAAGSSTVTATEQTRKLANDAATAARQIFTETRRQRDETERASAAMQTMADFVVEASASTTQTRAAVESLRHSILELERHTGQFKTRSSDAATRERGQT